MDLSVQCVHLRKVFWYDEGNADYGDARKVLRMHSISFEHGWANMSGIKSKIATEKGKITEFAKSKKGGGRHGQEYSSAADGDGKGN